MNALIIGNNDTLQLVISAELKKHDFEVIMSNKRAEIPVQDFDVCIDLSARGIRDVKRIVDRFNKRIAHYILLSTCQVYPSTPQLSPWHVGKIDLCDETGYSTVDKEVRRFRAAERELNHIGSRMMPWTILRPSIVESKKNPGENYMWWFVSRILDGGPVVLPDDDDPLFRHVSDADLAQAIRILAGKKEAFFQTVHVTNHTLLSFESYARLIMNGLGKKVPVVRVPGGRWRAAGLDLPMGKHLLSSFIDDSLLLDQLGWQPMEERKWVQEYARYLVDHPLAAPLERKRELALLDLSAEDFSEPAMQLEPDNWRIVAKAGKPYSFRLESYTEKREVPVPLLRTRKLVMGLAEERFMIELSTDTVSRIMGHNALLELIDPGDSNMQPGSYYLPVARGHCEDAACSFCTSGLSGATGDGFGVKYISLPQQHLVLVPGDLLHVALLADPLACLLSVLPSLLAENAGPVWIFGERADAVLAMLLVIEADRPVLHVGRTKVDQKYFPVDLNSMPLQRAQKKAKDNSLEKPAMVINLSGAKDGENLLVSALSEGGFLVTPFSVTQTHRRRINVNLPLAAPGQLWLERAIERLRVWSTLYDLHSCLQPIPLAHYHDLFIAGQFRQPCVDTMGACK